MSNLKFGCDPEFFIKDSNVNTSKEFLDHGVFVRTPAAMEMFDGMKVVIDDDKHPVYIDEKDAITPFRYVMDGVAMELNFRRPFTSVHQFFDSVQQAKVTLVDFLKPFGYEASFLPVVNFDYRRWWTNDLMENPRFAQGVIFGCDPDVDAFNVDWLCEIQSTATHPFRYGGGHIHVSGDEVLEIHPIPCVKLFAITVGNYCTAHSTLPNLEAERAKYYGKPGKHRVQHYPDGTSGVEYRTPSNNWASWDEETFEGMFKWIDKALYFVRNPRIGKEILDRFADDTIRAITTADSAMSETILGQL